MRRRSQLYVPANNPRMIAKAATLDADSIVFDLEDGVPLGEKASARKGLPSAIREADWGRREIAVRINALGTDDGDRDLAALRSEPRIDSLVVPKADSDLSAAAKGTGKGLIPLIETARGLLRIEEVVRSEGVVAVSYGAGDLAASVGGDIEAYGRNVTVKTLVVVAIDKVFFDLADEEGFRAEALEAKRLGYAGKQVVHPDQVRLSNEVFSPTVDELRNAKEIVESYEAAARAGKGAIRVGDRLVDAVHYRWAKRILEHAGP